MKTTKPISVLVIGMGPTPALLQLREDGHDVRFADASILEDATGAVPDMIIGPHLWRYLPDVSDKFIKLIVKEARAAQPPRIKKEKAKRGAATS